MLRGSLERTRFSIELSGAIVATLQVRNRSFTSAFRSRARPRGKQFSLEFVSETERLALVLSIARRERDVAVQRDCRTHPPVGPQMRVDLCQERERLPASELVRIAGRMTFVVRALADNATGTDAVTHEFEQRAVRIADGDTIFRRSPRCSAVSVMVPSPSIRPAIYAAVGSSSRLTLRYADMDGAGKGSASFGRGKLAT